MLNHTVLARKQQGEAAPLGPKLSQADVHAGASSLLALAAIARRRPLFQRRFLPLVQPHAGPLRLHKCLRLSWALGKALGCKGRVGSRAVWASGDCLHSDLSRTRTTPNTGLVHTSQTQTISSPIRMAASTVALRPCPCAQCTSTLRPDARCANAQLTPCARMTRVQSGKDSEQDKQPVGYKS